MASFLALSVAMAVVALTAQPSTLSQRGALQPAVLVTTLSGDDVAKQAAAGTLEHDTEVARSEAVTIVVTIAACEPAEGGGTCNASAAVTAYRPDGTVHHEIKNLSLNSRRATAPLPLAAGDATGLYRVVAVVRDLNGRRFGTAERIFGVK